MYVFPDVCPLVSWIVRPLQITDDAPPPNLRITQWVVYAVETRRNACLSNGERSDEPTSQKWIDPGRKRPSLFVHTQARLNAGG